MSAHSKRKSVVPEKPPDVSSDSEEELYLLDEGGTTVDGIYIPPPTNPVCSFNPTGPRLIITKIVNSYFKSYGENELVGPFHKCFNAVIGPNGSGKSNVIDSMLFVFGYRAAKIRCKKVSVLIHNSKLHQKIQSATVKVHFAQIIDKDGDNYDIVPGSEFAVSRTALHDNSSYYMLNEKRVQFKEVAVLLKKYGIDLDHNRFLILQGEVEQIAMMKCKSENPNETGFLEYLEDIIGTSRYIKPLNLLHERVERLSDIKSEKINRLKLVQTDMDSLKEPMEEAIDYLKAENTVVRCKNVLYQNNIFDLENELQSIQEESDTIKASKQELDNKIASISEEKTVKENDLKAKSTKYNALVKKKTTLKEAFDKASNKDVELQTEMVQVNNNRKKTMELVAEEKKKLLQYERVPQQSEKDIEECIEKEKELSVKKKELEVQKTELLASIKTETRPLQEKKEVLETDLIVLSKTVDETKSAFSLAECELKICRSNEENEKNKYESLKTTYENAESLLKQRREQVAVLKKKIPATQKSFSNATEEINAVKEEEAQIRRDVNTKRAYLQESRSSMQASKSRSKVLDSLMQQKREGNCPGLFGRLGDLGAIDQKYDVAISTACGPLDNIVVDTVTTAEWCIEFLKRHDIGRATFIALEKQEHLRHQASSRIQTPENVPRLYDLIKIQDDRVRTAFYFALRDTLVANEIDQASRIAYGAKRYRVVTLGGDIIETTGTMSGGGKTVSRGRMGQSVAVTSVNPRDLDKLERELQVLEDCLRSLRDRHVALENQINALEPELRQMEIDNKKYAMELQSLSQQQPVLLKQLKAQEEKAKSTKSDEAQVKKLTEIVRTCKAKYDSAAEAAQELHEQVDELTQEIKAQTIGRMKKMDKSISDISKTIDKLKAEITRLKVSIKTAERNAKKSSEKIATMEQDIKTSESRLHQMKAQRDEIESDGTKLLKCLEKIETELSSEENDFSDVKNEIDELKEKLNKLKSEQVDVNQKLKIFNGKVNEKKSTMHQWNVKITQLKLQEIPNTTLEPLKKFTKEEIEETNFEIVNRDMKLAEQKVTSTKPNFGAIEDYYAKRTVYMERSKELEEISQKWKNMKELHDKLREQRKQEFLTGFHAIRSKLKEMYQMITLGGDADFELVDSFDPFTEGIQFNVRPPKKSWKKISNLSGGEKTLSSLALVFALHYYKPSPLYVMDEIDAALDFKNVSIVGHYIKERTRNAQFIIISLRPQMFELCENLVGIYKTYDTSHSVSIDPRIYDKPEIDVVPTTQQVDVPVVEQADATAAPPLTEQITHQEERGDDSLEPESSQEPADEGFQQSLQETTSDTSMDSEPEKSDVSDKIIDDSMEVN